VINALVLAGLNNGAIKPEGLYLEYGNGLHPLQCLTSNFLHGGVLHLVGNMVFLWVFGVLIEGKTGWWFGPLYLGIGILESAAEQAMMLGAVDVEGSLGASSILYGLLAIAALWAAKERGLRFFSLLDARQDFPRHDSNVLLALRPVGLWLGDYWATARTHW
jgi:membrane associated rhomboid family serine protease